MMKKIYVTSMVCALALVGSSTGIASAVQRNDPPPAASEWSGRLDYGVLAPGGETTGIVLTTEKGKFELEPAGPAMRNQMKDLNTKQVVVRGTLRTVQGVEVKERHLIKVTKVTAKPKGN